MAPLMSIADWLLLQYRLCSVEKLEQVTIKPKRFSTAFSVSAVNVTVSADKIGRVNATLHNSGHKGMTGHTPMWVPRSKSEVSNNK